jgi:Protein of unknown function (DUF2568)
VSGLRGVTLTLRFLCELAMLATLAYWGFTVGDGVGAWVLGVGAPLLAAVVVGIMEFRDGKVVRERIYFGEPWEPPAWRAQLVEPMEEPVASQSSSSVLPRPPAERCQRGSWSSRTVLADRPSR